MYQVRMLSENITLLNLNVVRKAAYQFNIYCKVEMP